MTVFLKISLDHPCIFFQVVTPIPSFFLQFENSYTSLYQKAIWDLILDVTRTHFLNSDIIYKREKLDYIIKLIKKPIFIHIPQSHCTSANVNRRSNIINKNSRNRRSETCKMER